MIHEARVIPLDAADVGNAVAQDMGAQRGHGKATRGGRDSNFRNEARIATRIGDAEARRASRA